jgi:hypothetical protein
MKGSSHMKRAMFALVAIGMTVGLAGCTWPRGRGLTGLVPGSCQAAPENCAACGEGCGATCDAAGAENDPNCCGDPARCRCPRCCRAREAFTPGPPSGTVTYPYYTNRGPRDFLARSPQSIGP